MAIVPTYDLKERPVVGAGTAPTQYRDYSGLVPKADSLVSASAEGVAKVALKYQNQVDDTRADDVYVQMQKKALELQDAYLKRKGEAALTPDEQGRGLADQNQEDLHGYFNQITEGLTPGAKTRAMRKVNPLLMGQYALSTAHVRSQFSAYSDQVDKSLVEAQMQAARQNYEDPMAIEINAQTAAGQLEKTAVRHGWDPVTLANAKQSAVDAVVASAVSGALDASKEDPAYAVMARGILESYKDKLSGGASAKLYKAVTTVQDGWQLESEKDAARRELAADRIRLTIPGSAAARDAGITPGSSIEYFRTSIVPEESGGEQFEKDGRPKLGRYSDGTTPRDKSNWAYGAAQITIPAAMEAAKALGVPLDKDRLMNDKEYNLKLGEAYFNSLVSHYGGDLVKATAAYHSGAGTVDGLIKTRGGDWVSGLGPQGKSYVEKVQQRYNAAASGVRKDSSGNVINPFTPQYAMSSPQYFTREEAEAWAMGRSTRAQQSPEYRKKLVDAIMERQTQDINDDRQRQANLVGEAQDLIVQGKELPTELTALMTPATQNALQEFKTKYEQGDGSGDLRLAAYYLSTPEALQGLTETELKNVLSVIPASYRENVAWTYYTTTFKAQAAADKSAQLSSEAQSGQIAPEYYVSFDAVESSLKSYMGKAWGSLSSEDQAQYVTMAMKAVSREAQRRGTPIKSQSEIASLFNDMASSTQFTVPTGWFGRSSENRSIFTLTKDDMKNKGMSTSAWGVLKQLVQSEHTRMGNPYPPSEGQIMSTFQEVMMGMTPQVSLKGVELDQGVVDFLNQQAASEKRTLTPLQLLQAYLKFQIEGKEVPESIRAAAASKSASGSRPHPTAREITERLENAPDSIWDD